MYPNLERYEDFSPNFFQSYQLSDFIIQGKGIESVTFKSNTEGTYFSLSPAGFYVNDNEQVAEQIITEASREYSDLSLENSQYTAEELSEYSDGLAYGNIYCDTFKYTNTKYSDRINLSSKIEFIVESNHNDKEVSEKLDRMWECEQTLTKIKATHTFECGEISEQEEMLYQEIDLLSVEIIQQVIKNATVDVTVKFTDGSEQTKSLKVGLTENDNSVMWLTVIE